jgi:hypothetical protein
LLDDLVALSDVPSHIPGPHRFCLATIVRWHRIGVRGRKLPTVLIGGRRFVSLAQLDRFIRGEDPLSEPCNSPSSNLPRSAKFRETVTCR